MTRATSRVPAKTRRYRVTFVGPKGGYHHLPFTFKLNQMILPGDDKKPRSTAIVQKMNSDGWLTRTVSWYNPSLMVDGRYPENPHGIALYRLHKNDVYNSKLVKPGWRIVGEY